MGVVAGGRKVVSMACLRGPAFSGQVIAVNSRGFLPFQELVHNFLRSTVAEPRMEKSLIIAKLDPPRNVLPCFVPGRVDSPVDQLDFQSSR